MLTRASTRTRRIRNPCRFTAKSALTQLSGALGARGCSEVAGSARRLRMRFPHGRPKRVAQACIQNAGHCKACPGADGRSLWRAQNINPLFQCSGSTTSHGVQAAAGSIPPSLHRKDQGPPLTGRPFFASAARREKGRRPPGRRPECAISVRRYAASLRLMPNKPTNAEPISQTAGGMGTGLTE